jgi:RNA polymerase sigma-70 factor, ECF subfamily
MQTLPLNSGSLRLDKNELVEIYDQYSPGLYRYALRLLGDPDLAEECVAETFSRFLQALKRGGGPTSNLQAYLYRVAHNWIIDYYRNKPALEQLPPELADDKLKNPLVQVTEDMQRERVRNAWFHLTPEQRQVIMLRFSFSGAFLLITLLVFLFGGAGMTALAAQAALPGDVLYPIKTSMEQAQLALSASPAGRANLQMEFAERRLLEIAGLIEEDQFQEIPAVTDRFEAHIRNKMVEVEDVANHDAQQAAGLSAQVSDALTRYAYTLSRMLEQVPEAVQVKMMRTIQNTWLAGNIGEIMFNGAIDSLGSHAWVIAGQAVAIHSSTEVKGTFAIGDVVQVRAVRNADGSLAARQIERVLAGMEEGGSANPDDGGAGGPGAGMSGSDEGQDGLGGDPDQTQGQYQNNTQSGSEGGGQFQNQTQDPNFQSPGDGKDDDQDSSQKQSPGQDGHQNPNDEGD